MAPRPSRAKTWSRWHLSIAVVVLVIVVLSLSQLRPDPGALAPFLSGFGPSASSSGAGDVASDGITSEAARPEQLSPGEAEDDAEKQSEDAGDRDHEVTGGAGQETPKQDETHLSTEVPQYGLFGGVLVQLPRRELVSRSTESGNYSQISFAGLNSYNPNLIPHPTRPDWYIVVAQKGASHGEQEEVVCEAKFVDEALVCDERPTIIPTTESIPGGCQGQYSMLNEFPGPRDARLAYSPAGPYLVYGSQSHYACLGIWAQDLRTMVDFFGPDQLSPKMWYQEATELWRPPPHDALQKNFFMFWDSHNNTYVQSDAAPKRVLARLDAEGHVAEDFTPVVEAHDKECMAKYMPVAKVSGKAIEHQSTHQSTNSLAITMCKRADAGCTPDETNTFVMHLIHHKVTYSLHPVYEPYLVLFQHDAPFKLHAIAQKAFWIRGRAAPQAEARLAGKTTHEIPKGQSEMFYVTSMSWKTAGQTYHGYMDDPLFLAFGIEDSLAGVTEVLASDLLQDLAFC